MKKKLFGYVFFTLALATAAGCATGPNPQANSPDAHGRPAGIGLGIWHGVISPVTLVVSFFSPGVQIYEVHNDGGLYNFGFLLGVAIVFVLLGVFAGSRRR